MRVTTDKESPHYFHGHLVKYEPWIDGQPLVDCVLADEEKGLARVLKGGEVVELRGHVELRPRRRLRLVK